MVEKAVDNLNQWTIHSLRKALSPYGRPDLRKAILQLVTTFIPYFAIWAVCVYMLNHGYPFRTIFALILLASLFLVRIFIFFHDCTHGSYFASNQANRILGHIAGILTFTPFDYWRLTHNIHHKTYADLDHRGRGAIRTLTVEEYLAAPPRKRLAYRLYRNPIVFLGIGPGYTFLIAQRFQHFRKKRDKHHGIFFTNVAICVVLVLASLTIGWQTYLLIQLPIMLVAGAIGVWLFYVQHQFEGVYWSRHENWDPLKAALQGSSYYKLPKILQWFSGNIGLHHVHHVLPRIPNYKLQNCYDEIPVLQQVRPLTIRRSLKSLWLNLWDEEQKTLVSFRSLKFRDGVFSKA